MDRRYDLLIEVAFTLVGVFILTFARKIPMGFHMDAVGPRAFFYGVGILLFLGGGLGVLQRLRSWKSQKSHLVPSEGTDDEEGYPASSVRAASFIGVSIVSVALWYSLGYLLATPIFIIGTLAILGERKWGWIIISAVLFTVVNYVLFAIVLNCPVPAGPFTDLFRDLGWITL